MASSIVDRRDMDFVLYEQLGITALTARKNTAIFRSRNSTWFWIKRWSLPRTTWPPLTLTEIAWSPVERGKSYPTAIFPRTLAAVCPAGIGGVR